MLTVGTSGWQYKDWRGPFYPPKLPQRLWLEHYADHFGAVEVNNAFYRLPEKSTFEQWRERTPDGFRFAVKMSRYLTHIKRLHDPEEPVARFLNHAQGLGDKLGPVLIQLPPTLSASLDDLDKTLKAFPDYVRVVVEPRHPSWFTDECRSLLERRKAALCWADRRGRPQTPLWVTADFVYLRLHEGGASPWPHYGRAALKSWRGRLDGVRDKFVFFNNDQHAAAPADADTLLQSYSARR